MGDLAPIQKTGQALARRVEDALVILNPESGEYYTLNEVGARIWELLDLALGVPRDRTVWDPTAGRASAHLRRPAG